MLRHYSNGDAELSVQIGGDVADIVDICVPAARRRQGVATRLLQEALVDLAAQGVREVFLEVRASNAPAIGLYGKLGAVKTGLRRAYYSQPVEDGVVYVFRL